MPSINRPGHEKLKLNVYLALSGIMGLSNIRNAFKDLKEFRNVCTENKATFEYVGVPENEVSKLVYSPDMAKIENCITQHLYNPLYCQIRSKVERMIENDIQNNNFRMIVHCEMQLITYILKILEEGNIPPQEIYDYIACSKRPCYLGMFRCNQP